MATIAYDGISPGAIATRGMCLRVTLRGALDWLYILDVSDFANFNRRVEEWRARVEASRLEVAATASPAAVSSGQTGVLGIPSPGPVQREDRAVVDVRLNSTEPGLTISALTLRMHNLLPGVDVVRIAKIATITDATGRGAALLNEEDKAHSGTLSTIGEALDQLFKRLGSVLLVTAVVGGVVLVVYLRRQLK